MSEQAIYVVDASVGIKLVVPEVNSELAAELLSRTELVLHVPDLFFVECANILWKKTRRGEFAPTDAVSGLARLREVEPSVTPTAHLVDRAFSIANEVDISAYDACYVALAERLSVPFITADDKLVARLEGTMHQVITLTTINT